METDLLKKRYALLAPVLDERRLRLYVGAEALARGYGGRAVVAQATGVSRPTITAGCKELLAAGKRQPPQETSGRVRKPGAGRKRISETAETLRTDLESLIEPVTRGDPESPLRWTSKSVRQLADELQRMGHQTRHRRVAVRLHEMDYSLQANRKTLAGSAHPDRDAQFGHIHQGPVDPLSTLRTEAPLVEYCPGLPCEAPTALSQRRAEAPLPDREASRATDPDAG